MNVLVTGACGFVGSVLVRTIIESGLGWEVVGFDNLSRPGSERNRTELRTLLGVRLFHGDLRCLSDLEALPAVDWVIDCAANPSVLAGADGRTSSLQLMEHNLFGTVHLLEKCRRDQAGFILLSTSRVYSIPPLAGLPVEVRASAYAPAIGRADPGDAGPPLPPGLGTNGITEEFSTAPPVSLYGSTKLASETLAVEYGETFGFPVWVNRCGVLAGAGQFGKPDQGIFAYWIHSWREGLPLRYIGFDGMGHQVRDCLHPRDLVPLLAKQVASTPTPSDPRVFNVSGGLASARSLRQLSDWCAARFPLAPPQPLLETSALPSSRPFDLPWVVLDSSLATGFWDWQPQISTDSILEEIASFADHTPGWIAFSAP